MNNNTHVVQNKQPSHTRHSRAFHRNKALSDTWLREMDSGRLAPFARRWR